MNVTIAKLIEYSMRDVDWRFQDLTSEERAIVGDARGLEDVRIEVERTLEEHARASRSPKTVAVSSDGTWFVVDQSTQFVLATVAEVERALTSGDLPEGIALTAVFTRDI